MPENGEITANIHHNIATIEFYHPKGNSMPGRLLGELTQTITETGSKEYVKVIVLKSRGEGAFCGGASFDELIAIDSSKEGKDFFMGFANVLNAMRQCPRLIIVRVQGKTVGGGVGLAAAGDYTIAHESAAVKLSELALGIGPFVVGPAVKRKMGAAAFSAMTIDAGSWHDAHWAKREGLFSKVCKTHAELDEQVDHLSIKLAGYSPEAMKELKKVFWEGTSGWDELLKERAKISGHLVLSEFTKAFIREFKKS